jgi:hypothetical protein
MRAVGAGLLLGQLAERAGQIDVTDKVSAHRIRRSRLSSSDFSTAAWRKSSSVAKW